MGPKGAVSKNFLYINQHFSSTGFVGGKYLSGRTKDKKTLKFIFIIFFLCWKKVADFVAFKFVVARQLQKSYAIFCFVLFRFFVFCSCFPGKKSCCRVFADFRRLRVRCLREKSADSSLFVHVWTAVTGSVYNRKCHGLVQLLHGHLSTVSFSSLIEQVISIILALLWCLSFLIIELLSWSRAFVAVCEFLYVLIKSFDKFSNSRSCLITSDFIDFPAYSTSSKDLTRVKFVFKPYLCRATLPSCNKFSGSDFLNTLPFVIPETMDPLRERRICIILWAVSKLLLFCVVTRELITVHTYLLRVSWLVGELNWCEGSRRLPILSG